MNANIIKRAPKWAWLTGAGVGAGVIGLHLWRNRAAPADNSQTASTVGDGTVPGSTGSSPTPVIVPPVINQTPSDSNGGADAASVLTAISGIFTPIIDDFTTVIGAQQGTITTVVAQEGSDLQTAVGAIQANNDSWLSALAAGGVAPQPAASQPIVIYAASSSPSVAAAPVQGPAPAQCPGAFPHRSARGCYRCERHGNKYTHIYQDGHRVGENTQC